MKPLVEMICDFIEIHFPEVRATFLLYSPDAYINMKYDYCGRKADKYVELKGNRLLLCNKPEMVIDFHDPESFDKLKERLDWCINYDCHECIDRVHNIMLKFNLVRGIERLEEKREITTPTKELWLKIVHK